MLIRMHLYLPLIALFLKGLKLGGEYPTCFERVLLSSKDGLELLE